MEGEKDVRQMREQKIVESSAAVKMQSVQRRRRASRQVTQMKEERNAAIKMQSVQRRRRASRHAHPNEGRAQCCNQNAKRAETAKGIETSNANERGA